jgi:hypothetical protein
MGSTNGLAAEPEISASYLAAVTDFLAAQNTATAVEEQMTYSVSQQAFGSLAAQGIVITEPMQAIILDEAKKSFGSKFADTDYLAKLYAPTYLGQLSESELHELSVFWTSPLGKKMLAVNRKLSEGTLAALQQASQEFLPIFQEKVDARLAAAGITYQP